MANTSTITGDLVVTGASVATGSATHGLTAVQVNGGGSTPALGFGVRNTTASTAGTTVQAGPTSEQESHARVSSTDKTMLSRVYTLARTSDNVDVIFEMKRGGAAWVEFLRLTTSEANLFEQGVLGSGFITSTGYGIRFQNGSGLMRYVLGGGGVNLISYDSSDPLYLAGDAGVQIQPKNSDGTTKVPQVLFDGATLQTTTATTSTAYSYTGATGTTIEIQATTISRSGTDTAVCTRRAVVKFSGGTATLVDTVDTIGADKINAALAGVSSTIDVSGGAVRVRLTSIAATINTGTSVTIRKYTP